MATRIRLFLPLLASIVAATALFAQKLPATPPDQDPAFWGRPHHPYTLALTVTHTVVHAAKPADAAVLPTPPETSTAQEKIYRDDAGRVRVEDFYDNGRPSGGVLRDPAQRTSIILKTVAKSAIVLPDPRSSYDGWIVEPLPSKTIAGLPAEGMRFTRPVPSTPEDNSPTSKIIDDLWISQELGVVLEQVYADPRFGKFTKLVTRLDPVEADPSLFRIPTDYAQEKLSPAAP